jgi:hypothetical protein
VTGGAPADGGIDGSPTHDRSRLLPPRHVEEVDVDLGQDQRLGGMAWNRLSTSATCSG